MFRRVGKSGGISKLIETHPCYKKIEKLSVTSFPDGRMILEYSTVAEFRYQATMSDKASGFE